MRLASITLALLVLAPACITPPTGDRDLPALDFEVYENDVQPILAERCANPTCHGRADRPLSIYAPGRYREDPSRTYLHEPLTEEELVVNYLGACAFSLGITDPGDCLLLRKPLAVDAGGAGHVGGDVWMAEDDAEYRVVEAWLAGGTR